MHFLADVFPWKCHGAIHIAARGRTVVVVEALEERGRPAVRRRPVPHLPPVRRHRLR
jgi:hypothetical protein